MGKRLDKTMDDKIEATTAVMYAYLATVLPNDAESNGRIMESSVVENQMEKTMNNDVEAITGGLVRVSH